MTKIVKALFSRAMLMVILALVEVIFLITVFEWFGQRATWIEEVIRILSVLIVLGIIKNSRHLSSDLIWILIIILAPVPGTVAYLFLAGNLFTSRTFRNISNSTEKSAHYYHQDPEIMKELSRFKPDLAGQFRYISESSGFPFYYNRSLDYYPLGDEGYPVMLEEMKKAEKFIFLEYFIIEEGKMWNSMLEILEEKAAKGLDVRVMYDDFGSFMTLSAGYARKLEEKGIKCVPFNRINPIIGSIMNHRDHRKIMVIDGKTAFSGGINLADEYINVKKRFGKWKDNVIRVKGEAAWSFTVLFLTHWNALRQEDESYLKFKCEDFKETEHDGYIAPYGDTPLDSENTAQNIYMSILNHANEYCYIFTPYLIIDSEFINALILSAKHGVDVRIMTPGIPDKKLVWMITKSYYQTLIEGGVKIYEYSPGFVHSKVFVSDDEVATVGTVNLDYRSLYLHFENGTFICGSKTIKDIKDDFTEACKQAHEITLEESREGFIRGFIQSVLRLIAPLM